jgi:hypothetical protein
MKMIFFLLLSLVQNPSAKHFKLILKSRWGKGTPLKKRKVSNFAGWISRPRWVILKITRGKGSLRSCRSARWLRRIVRGRR